MSSDCTVSGAPAAGTTAQLYKVPGIIMLLSTV